MAKGKTIEIKYTGTGSYSYGGWTIQSGETQEIPSADWEHLEKTNQAQDLSIVK